MKLAVGLTADLTAGLTLLSVNPTATRCAWCNGPLVKPRRGKRFCSDSHRQMDNAARWAAAPLAVYGWLVGVTGSARVPSVAQIANALEVVTPKRRANFMVQIGLTWFSKERVWK